MIVSMTGYGKSTKKIRGIEFTAEMRSVNSKFLEVSARLPAALIDKENDVKEIIRQKISRGKLTLNINVDMNTKSKLDLKLEPKIVKNYYKLLTSLKRIVKLKEEIKLEHLLQFSSIFKPLDTEELKKYWDNVKHVVTKSLDDLLTMKRKEGKVLEKDIVRRIGSIKKGLDKVAEEAKDNLEDYRTRLKEKVDFILSDKNLDPARVELEVVLLTDKLDVTEEVVRASSHLNYFVENMKTKDFSGRRLNFLVQEINREINTIASKSNNSKISQIVVEMKEELEKIREQLQNVE
jgi:uncharacterized protein (TIGR00255 family)